MNKLYTLKKGYNKSISRHLRELNVNDQLDTTERLIALSIHERNDDQGIGSFINTAISTVATIVATLALIFSSDFLDPSNSVPTWVILVLVGSVYVVLVFVCIQAFMSRLKNRNISPMEATLAIIQHRREIAVSNPEDKKRTRKDSQSRTKYLSLGIALGMIADKVLSQPSKLSCQAHSLKHVES